MRDEINISAVEETPTTETPEEKTVESLQSELAAMRDQWLRAVAEAENVKRRAAKEREEALKYSVTNFARDMLTIADNLRRALENSPDRETLPEAVKALLEGVGMTETQLLSTLERYGIRLINPLHEKFDPHFHQAMFEVETQEQEAGVVMQVMQPGYVLHDRLLRPALVGVSKVSQ